MEYFGKLVSVRDGKRQEFALGKVTISIGRALTNDVVLPDAKISRNHARLEHTDNGWTIFNLGSANGTQVNGEPVERAALKAGDVIGIGTSLLTLETSPLRTEPEVLRLDSESDVDKTLMEASVPVQLHETNLPRLVIHTAERTWQVPFDSEALRIGRADDNDVVLAVPQASRHHARVERRGDDFILRDLDSTNGTWIRTQRVAEQALQNGDTIRIGSAQLVFKRGHTSDDLTIVETPKPSPAHGMGRYPVVLVPPLLASELWRGSEKIWPSPRVFLTNPEILRLPDAHPLEARAVSGELVIVPNLIKLQGYTRLGDFLEEALGYERGKDLLEVPYDWRQDMRLSARRVAEAIENWQVSPPIVLVAHSLGTQVARYYVERLGGKNRVGRLILLGGPNAGTPASLSSLARGPDMLFGLLGQRLREVLATFPSMYQILPEYACVVDQAGNNLEPLHEEGWVSEAQRPLLRDARQFRQELGRASSVPTVSIFGYGIKTTMGLSVQRDEQGVWHKPQPDIQTRGDSAIPESSAVVPGTEIHPVQQFHGSLYVDSDVKMRLKLELSRAIG